MNSLTDAGKSLPDDHRNFISMSAVEPTPGKFRSVTLTGVARLVLAFAGTMVPKAGEGADK